MTVRRIAMVLLLVTALLLFGGGLAVGLLLFWWELAAYCAAALGVTIATARWRTRYCVHGVDVTMTHCASCNDPDGTHGVTNA